MSLNMKSFIYLGGLMALFQMISSDQFQTVNDSIKKEIHSVSSDVSGLCSNIEHLVDKYRQDLEDFKQVVKQQLSGTDHMIYQWYSQSPGKYPRQCLASQRNLDMIRSRGNDTTVRCLSRVDGIVKNLRDKSKRLLATTDKFVQATGSLARPCEILDTQDECLSQAMEQVLQRKDSLAAILARFKIFAKLTAVEAKVNFKVCRFLGKAYSSTHQHEMQSVEKCMMKVSIREDQQADNKSDDTSPEMEKEVEHLFDSEEELSDELSGSVS